MTEQDEQIVDQLLVMECQDGSVAALEHLVSRWQKRLWRYACRLTGDAEAAWDVTQESWLGVIRGLSRLNDPARFRSWIYRIVTRKADDWIVRTVETKYQILYATIFISCFIGMGLVKIFAWQVLHKNSIKREIKRLELRIAELASSLDKATR